MANIYVRHTDGSDSDNGSTWALAKATLVGAAAIDSAGDTIWLSQAHAESNGTAQTINLAGTSASPVKVLCGNDAAEPPTTLATTASVTTTGASNIAINGSACFHGITFNCGTGTSAANLQPAATDNAYQIYDNCAFNLNTTHASSRLYIGASSAAAETLVTFNNCTVDFSAAGQGIAQLAANQFVWNGGSVDAASTVVTNLFATQATGLFNVLIKNVDLSILSTSNMVLGSVACPGRVDFVNCKMHASWSGQLVAAAPLHPGFRASMYNCDGGATNYRLWIETFAGSIKSEPVIVKTGGSSDGTTALSWKMTSSANANEYLAPLTSDDMQRWVDTIGSSKTITVDIIHDSATALTDSEVWLEIDYLGSSTTPKGTPASDKRATILTTPADQASSSATWTTTGMTNPNKQKLEVTFTPQMKGVVYARVALAKPSYTIYVDYEPTVA